jgi:hypothetical protein
MRSYFAIRETAEIAKAYAVLHALLVDGVRSRGGGKRVEPVRPPGRSRPASRGHHEPAAVAPGDWPADPTCWTNTITATSAHGEHQRARHAFLRITGFFAWLGQTAEQSTDLERWYRHPWLRLVVYQLDPPRRFERLIQHALVDRLLPVKDREPQVAGLRLNNRWPTATCMR